MNDPNVLKKIYFQDESQAFFALVNFSRKLTYIVALNHEATISTKVKGEGFESVGKFWKSI